MKNVVVVYESKYGYTEKYAKWISEELDTDLFSTSDINLEKLNNYNCIIYGGGLYAGRISGINLITKNYDKLKDKTVVVFTCGLADPKEEINIENIKVSLSKAFDEKAMKDIKFFHLRGGINYKKLNFMHKAMMAMIKKVLSKKDPKELKSEEVTLLDTYGKEIDFSDKDTIAPIVEFVKEVENYSSNK